MRLSISRGGETEDGEARIEGGPGNALCLSREPCLPQRTLSQLCATSKRGRKNNEEQNADIGSESDLNNILYLKMLGISLTIQNLLAADFWPSFLNRRGSRSKPACAHIQSNCFWNRRSSTLPSHKTPGTPANALRVDWNDNWSQAHPLAKS